MVQQTGQQWRTDPDTQHQADKYKYINSDYTSPVDQLRFAGVNPERLMHSLMMLGVMGLILHFIDLLVAMGTNSTTKHHDTKTRSKSTSGNSLVSSAVAKWMVGRHLGNRLGVERGDGRWKMAESAVSTVDNESLRPQGWWLANDFVSDWSLYEVLWSIAVSDGTKKEGRAIRRILSCPSPSCSPTTAKMKFQIYLIY